MLQYRQETSETCALFWILQTTPNVQGKIQNDVFLHLVALYLFHADFFHPAFL